VEKGRLERELQMARPGATQLAASCCPGSSRLGVTAGWLPARQVAGDYYDFISGQDGQLGLWWQMSRTKACGALFMALSRSIVRASIVPAYLPPPASSVQSLDLQDSTSGMSSPCSMSCSTHSQARWLM